MKQLAIVVTVLVFGGVAYLAATKTSTPVEYVAPEVQTVEKEVTVPELDKRVTEALSASSTEIQAAMDKAAQEAKESMETEIKLNVNRKMQAELKEQEAKLQDKVSL
jgi:hypothetical protein